jgi:DMSO/TMAO reductase YedYZ molybdopterin-dependent catalytic subunit
MSPKYGAFESNPARYTNYEAWVLFDNEWRKMNAAEVLNSARPMSQAKFMENFGKVPDLPATAFQEA